MKTLSDIKLRKGVLKISNRLLESMPLEVFKELFANFIPIDIKPEVPYNQIVFIGYSELFDELEEGETIPDYMAMFNHLKGKVLFEKFTRIKETDHDHSENG